MPGCCCRRASFSTGLSPDGRRNRLQEILDIDAFRVLDLPRSLAMNSAGLKVVILMGEAPSSTEPSAERSAETTRAP